MVCDNRPDVTEQLIGPPFVATLTAIVLAAPLVAQTVAIGVNGRNGLDGNGQLLLTSDRAEFVERFTPTGPDTLQYEVTVTDPATWTAPVRISFPLRRQSDYQILEYACHEGNYSIRNTLSGSRAEER